MTPELETLIRKALEFANWAAGEGICPAQITDKISDPEEFIMDYSDATGWEDWDNLADHVVGQLKGNFAIDENGNKVWFW